MAASTRPVPGRIFISYRRGDAGYPAGWLYDQVVDHFGLGQVFMDVNSIQHGEDFAEGITAAVESSGVLLAVIGQRWLTATDEQGRRQLDNPSDLVRLEIQAALARGIRVIPVLVDGAQMPRADQLPPSLAALAHRNALELNPAHFGADTGRLLAVLDRTLDAARVGDVAEAAIPGSPPRSAGSPPRSAGSPPRSAGSSPRRRQRSVLALEKRRSIITFWRRPTIGRRVAPAQPSSSASWQPTVYDDLVHRFFAEEVQPGRLLFNPPDQMRLGETERVEVRLARTLELDDELRDHLRGHGEPRLEEIETAPLMAVTLKGDGFQITAYSDEEQSVSQDRPTTWEFDIRAKERGQQRLVLAVSLRIPVPGQHAGHKSIPVREVTIDVQVGKAAIVGHFVSGNWRWLAGTAIAIAAVVVAIFH